MNTAEIKISKIVELLGNTDESTLDKIIGLLKSSSKNENIRSVDDLPEEVIEGIKRGQNQIKNGQFTNHAEVKSEYQKRFPNANI
ncbi:hypothetical protein [Crocinitomix catalasitica]|uniref:hypothetical protein n=1 Tax=Crocinitomix catalasitica TaxID=184607 RepID=UPI000482C90A|nr:hypothetical protein [Crocinitomix catalasitica]